MIRDTLTGKQKSFLRSLGMTIEPVVQIGKEGVTAQVVQATRDVVKKRELVKVSVLQNAPDTPEALITKLAERSDVNLVQIIGRKGLFYKKNQENPKIELP